MSYDCFFTLNLTVSALCLFCSLSLAIFPLAAFIVEKLAQQKCIYEPVSYQNSNQLYFSSAWGDRMRSLFPL